MHLFWPWSFKHSVFKTYIFKTYVLKNYVLKSYVLKSNFVKNYVVKNNLAKPLSLWLVVIIGFLTAGPLHAQQIPGIISQPLEDGGQQW